jgi:putative transposase
MTKTNSIRQKRSYSTFTKYCYQKGTIPKDLQKSIPRSTRYSWSKQTVSGIDDTPLIAFEKESLELAEIITAKQKTVKLCSTLEIVINVYRKIIADAKHKKQLLFENKKLILELVDSLKDEIGILKICEYLSISTCQYYAWKNNVDCNASLLKLCRKKFSNQLEDKEIAILKSFMENKAFDLLSRKTIYYKILRDSTASFSLTCFYKYCKLLGYGKRKRYDKCKKNKKGFKATRVWEILHTDITQVKTKDGKTSYLSFVEDNFSKNILLGRATEKPDSTFLKENIKTVIQQYDLSYTPIQLVVDGGAENKGALDEYLKASTNLITKIVARLEDDFANNMVEAFHKKFKTEFLRNYMFENHADLVAALQPLIIEYNNQYHGSLYGYSPKEVLEGAIPNKDKFKEELANARANRLAANRTFNCCKALII